MVTSLRADVASRCVRLRNTFRQDSDGLVSIILTSADASRSPRSLNSRRTRCVSFSFGPSSAGKTTLAVALLRALLEKRVASHPFECGEDVVAVARQCRFVPARRLGVAALVPGDPLEIRRAMRVPVLLLDDLGKDADIKSNPVPAVIAERHDEERVTWITTELTPPEIGSDTATASRVGSAREPKSFGSSTQPGNGRCRPHAELIRARPSIR